MEGVEKKAPIDQAVAQCTAGGAEVRHRTIKTALELETPAQRLFDLVQVAIGGDRFRPLAWGSTGVVETRLCHRRQANRGNGQGNRDETSGTSPPPDEFFHGCLLDVARVCRGSYVQSSAMMVVAALRSGNFAFFMGYMNLTDKGCSRTGPPLDSASTREMRIRAASRVKGG